MKTALTSAAFLLLTTAAQAETYRLVHAIGNKERVAAEGLSKPECERKKRELKATAEALGTRGSITCLPEGVFK